MTTNLLVKRLIKDAILPTSGSQLAAGYDLYSVESKEILSNSRSIIKTGISIRVPSGTYGRVAPRSGLAVKNGIDVLAGVIDEDYRGEVCVILQNLGTEIFIVKPGDRIAQLVLEKILKPEIEEVDELDSTQRGQNGFGSTGR